ASSPCAEFARRIMRCDATFGARRSDDGRERSRRKEKCLHAEDYSVEGRPTDKVKACATIDSRGRRSCWALTLRCGEKSSRQKTGLDVGIVKSAVADTADVLAGYVSKMWSQARNSFALDGLDGTSNFRFAFLDLRRQVRRFLAFQDSIDVARRWVSISENLRSEILVVPPPRKADQMPG